MAPSCATLFACWPELTVLLSDMRVAVNIPGWLQLSCVLHCSMVFLCGACVHGSAACLVIYQMSRSAYWVLVSPHWVCVYTTQLPATCAASQAVCSCSRQALTPCLLVTFMICPVHVGALPTALRSDHVQVMTASGVGCSI